MLIMKFCAARPAQAVGRHPDQEVGREPTVQGNRGFAKGFCPARRQVGPGHAGQPQDGREPFLR